MSSSLPPGTDLCSIPAAIPPPGQTPNFVDPPTLAAATIAVSAITIALATLFTAARLYTNIRKLRWADWFVLISLALSATYTGLILTMVEYSRHQWDIPILYAQGVILGPVIFFAKSSIFLMYLQIFTVLKPIRFAIYFGLFFTFILYWVGVPLESYFAAPHVGETWESLLTNGSPHHLIYWGLVQGSLSVALDIYIFILPLPMLSRLHLPRRKRLQVVAIFSTAMMGIVASVIALVFRVRLLTTTDIIWTQSVLFICVIMENNVAIIVSSMPFFATFIKNNFSESSLVRLFLSKISSHSEDSKSGTAPHVPNGEAIRKPSEDRLVNGRRHEMTEVNPRMETRIQGGGDPGSDQKDGITRETDIEQEVRSLSMV
ncbi:hypothetical protein BDV28DRAFT_162899 [Aspergillus coremiiformis]|uniref:Rhodopsin domain-containing protein n=1 Tax=Aspergillus coremiiformis TaxID=138285 RepID=A0A5N6YYJ6_9EURO|nr:hypothetical protein BDV28DRAFT_162899 [Aspergillus coremiiformis]